MWLPVLCFVHCARRCCFPAPSLYCFPARAHRAGQPGRDAVSLRCNTRWQARRHGAPPYYRQRWYAPELCGHGTARSWHLCVYTQGWKSVRLRTRLETQHMRGTASLPPPALLPCNEEIRSQNTNSHFHLIMRGVRMSGTYRCLFLIKSLRCKRSSAHASGCRTGVTAGRAAPCNPGKRPPRGG